MIFRATILAALLLGLAPPASAQETRIGAKLGIASAGFSDDVAGAETGADVGLVAGGFATLPRSRWIAIQPELLYARKGGEWREAGVERQLGVSYIEVPVLLRLELAPGDAPLAAYVAAGPYVAFEVGCTLERTGEGFDLDAACGNAELGADAALEAAGFDAGLAFGGAVGYPLERIGTAFLEARYGYGLLSVIEDAGEDLDVKNRTFAVLLGLSVPLGPIAF